MTTCNYSHSCPEASPPPRLQAPCPALSRPPVSRWINYNNTGRCVQSSKQPTQRHILSCQLCSCQKHNLLTLNFTAFFFLLKMKQNLLSLYFFEVLAITLAFFACCKGNIIWSSIWLTCEGTRYLARCLRRSGRWQASRICLQLQTELASAIIREGGWTDCCFTY